ncbi:MAG TPA: protein-disulfide reductase DsbD domain-containing protein [Bryobacteraceae bacterium]|nr:protein-disulfide reductase DsbD domain-containing protein [Bryobacteraceae bacterium]HUO31149.1 protein-disulfide reductase DsbD domain-containing protein [Bryobacteraceae bacterium]
MPALLFLLAASWPVLQAQGNGVLTVAPPSRLTIKRGATGELSVKANLQSGFHVNSNMPGDDYLIPIRLTWNKEPLEAEQVSYPKPQMEHLGFSANPVSVYTGTFEIVTRFKAPANASPGIAFMNGKLRYQACNNKECLAPRTVDVRVTLDIQ